MPPSEILARELASVAFPGGFERIGVSELIDGGVFDELEDQEVQLV